MNKVEFIKLLAKYMDTSATTADKTLKTVFDTIGEAIAQRRYTVICRVRYI